jgi:Ca2+-binding EF-hand superfamily protein
VTPAGQLTVIDDGALRRPVLRLCLALSAAALLGIAAPVGAQDSPQAYLARMDSNGDGRVDLDEYLAWMIHGFDRMDRNGNGVLDIDEQPAGARRAPVTRSDRLRALTAAFRRQDINGDGVLDARELAAPPR